MDQHIRHVGKWCSEKTVVDAVVQAADEMPGPQVFCAIYFPKVDEARQLRRPQSKEGFERRLQEAAEQSERLVEFDLNHYQKVMKQVEDAIFDRLGPDAADKPEGLIKQARDIGETLRDYGMRSTMSSFGTELFAGNIEVFRNIIDHADRCCPCKDHKREKSDKCEEHRKSAILSLLAATLIMIDYCSGDQDVTPGLVYGNALLTFMFREAVNRAPGLSFAKESHRTMYLSDLDKAYKHMMVALTSCVMCVASTRSNIDTGLTGRPADAARQDFVAVTMAGQMCRGCGIVH
ncbi:hypothetical protein P389DRAFT_196025 [Cystobasidium minutum MCA 4210]|uniref:uncharacterized protein n=1 Tax=Cystobasidium minutum MCA 4210 TaxID=1397322 RepID=UPI0034CF6ED8|eukprot:jgi/Rhomi1/196025/gm1.4239_g